MLWRPAEGRSCTAAVAATAGNAERERLQCLSQPASQQPAYGYRQVRFYTAEAKQAQHDGIGYGIWLSTREVLRAVLPSLCDDWQAAYQLHRSRLDGLLRWLTCDQQ